MDGNNLEKGNVQSGSEAQQPAQYSNYQDNTAQYNSSNYQAPPESNAGDKANGKQIAGLVCGIVGIVTSCCYGVPGIILGVAGLICSVLGNKESKNGVGIGGLVCSVIALISGVAMLIYYIVVIAAVLQEPGFMDSIMNGYYY